MWFEIENPDEILSPALLFYPDRIKDNLNQMIQVAGTSDRLRPHVKSHKSPELIGLQMKSGITKFKCATLEEARMVASCHAEDVLLAMPLSGPAQKGFLQLMEQYPHVRFSVLVDHPSQLAQWQALLKPLSHQLSVFIDIDAGMERTGIKPEKALRLLDQVLDEKIFHFAGLHVYDGHIHDTDYKQRVATCEQAFAPIDNLIKSIEATHGQIPEVVCGGSISFPIHANHPERTLSPGTTLLWDKGYGTHFPDLGFDIAAVMLTRVISKPGANKLCLDLGYKAIASEMQQPRVVFPQLGEVKIAGQSEEHLVIETPEAEQWNIGDVLYGLPWHICPTVALHERATLIENKNVVGYWEISARKRQYHV